MTQHVHDEVLRRRLAHVYWIGGANGAGKSAVASRLAARHGLRVDATDEVMADHAQRTRPDEGPLLAAFAAMDMDERSPPRADGRALARDNRG